MLLVLEDNADLCKAIARLLRILKIESQCFRHWSEARAELENNPALFQHALIDFGLENGDSGLDVICWIRRHYPHIHCILTSGARRVPEFQEDPPYQQFLPKPFRSSELLNAISI